MSEPSLPIHSISDTAHWVAYFRARESERPDALFDDLCRALAGARGFQIANTLAEGNKCDWAWVARTCLFDTFLLREIRNGIHLVVNLAAGLDARPYRMQLPTPCSGSKGICPTLSTSFPATNPDPIWSESPWICQTRWRAAHSSGS
jgi:hypothetical protein